MKLSNPYDDIARGHVIGNTDLVDLPAPGAQNHIFAKVEYQNHTGSHYDRVYLWLLNDLEQQGKIHPNHTTLVETTSGNAGISCAFIAQERGYQCVVFTPKGARPRCNELMRSFGADVREVPGDNYIAAARDGMADFLKENIRERSGGYRKYYSPNHSQVDISCEALALIATEAVGQAGHSFDCFIGGAGNGSTLRGIGEALKKDNPAIRMYAFDPSAALQAYQLKYGKVPGHTPHAHQLFGTGGWDIDFPHLTHAVKHLMDDVLIVEDEDWKQAQVELRKEGYDVGHTSAAAYHLARDYCRRHANQNVLIVFYDSADHY